MIDPELSFTWQGVEALHNDEHVVYPDPEQQERHHGMGGRVEEAKSRAQAIADLWCTSCYYMFILIYIDI